MARSITTRSTNPKIMDDNIKILDDALAIASAPPAEDVVYDNTDSGLTADDVQEAIDEISNQQDKDLIASTKAWPGASLVFSDIEPSNSQVYRLTAIESGSATNFVDYYVIVRTNNTAYASKISGQNATFTYDNTEKTLSVALPLSAYYVYSFKKIKTNY